jgi:hypothetical protein
MIKEVYRADLTICCPRFCWKLRVAWDREEIDRPAMANLGISHRPANFAGLLFR